MTATVLIKIHQRQQSPSQTLPTVRGICNDGMNDQRYGRSDTRNPTAPRQLTLCKYPPDLG